jgi:pimeloyl-ACP methyl ester carboxylesterase
VNHGDPSRGTAMERFAPAMVCLEPLVDPNLSVGYELTSQSKTMLIAFAALAPYKPPPFHLFEFTSSLTVKRMFVRDPERVWFQRGIPGFGQTIDEAAASLRLVLEEQEIERLVMIGNSAGGYGAMVFGALLEADLVLAFSPQTFLDRAWMEEGGDRRWAANFKMLAEHGGPDPRWVDLRDALPRERRERTVFEVHYPVNFELDVRQAERLEGVEGVEMRPHERGYHNFIQTLRNNGELSEILRVAGIEARVHLR